MGEGSGGEVVVKRDLVRGAPYHRRQPFLRSLVGDRLCF